MSFRFQSGTVNTPTRVPLRGVSGTTLAESVHRLTKYQNEQMAGGASVTSVLFRVGQDTKSAEKSWDVP